MAYRKTVLHTQVGDDQNLTNLEWDRRAVVDQTLDQQVFVGGRTVNPADADTLIPITPVVNGYYYEIRSDYPVMFRINGNTATQQTMKSNNVQPVNVGAPSPDRCFAAATAAVTSIYIAPIAGATQAAKVKILVLGDPINSYT